MMIGSIVHVLVKLHLVHNPEVPVEEVMQDAGYHFNSNTPEAKIVETEIVESEVMEANFDPGEYIEKDKVNPYYIEKDKVNPYYIEKDKVNPYLDMDPSLELERAVGLLQALTHNPQDDIYLDSEADSFLDRHRHLLHHDMKVTHKFPKNGWQD